MIDFFHSGREPKELPFATPCARMIRLEWSIYMRISEPVATACKEKVRLLRRCAVADAKYGYAIQKLTWRIGEVKYPNYEELQNLAEAATKLVKNARDALERHASEHGC